MTLRSRLKQLTDVARRGYDTRLGCAACRQRRGRIVLVTSRQQPDGTVIPGDDMPVPCAACGKVPEQVVEFVKPFVTYDAIGNVVVVPLPTPEET